MALGEFVALEAADAVFGREGAAQGVEQVVDARVDRAFPAGQEVSGGYAGGGHDVVVQVAVAPVAEVDRAGAGHQGLHGGIGLGDEGGDAGDGQGDVVLDVQAVAGLGQRDGFAQAPEVGRLAQGLSHQGGVDEAVVQGSGQQGFERGAGTVGVVGVAGLQQDGPGGLAVVTLTVGIGVGATVGAMGRRQELVRHGLRQVVGDQGDRGGVHDLAGGQGATAVGQGALQQGDGGIGAGASCQRGGGAAWRGVQAQHGGGDFAH